jgi:ribosomal-protein-alanine N-acetyltransferase
LVGSINLDPTFDGRATVGYWVGKEHEGQGYTSDALETIIGFAFNELDHEGLDAEAVWENTGSRHVLEKAGFAETGDVRGRSYVTLTGEEANRLYVVYAKEHPLT